MEKKDGKLFAINVCRYIFNNGLLIGLLLLMGLKSPEPNYSSFEYVCEIEEQMEKIKQDFDCKIEEVLMDSRVLANLYMQNNWVWKYIKIHKKLPGKDNIIFKYSVSNPQMSTELLAAWLDYDGPFIYKTSCTRHLNNWSAHRWGAASDVTYSPQFIQWTGTASGKSWLNRHGLNFYIEDTYWSSVLKRWYKTEHRKRVKMNVNATAKHIHVYRK